MSSVKGKLEYMDFICDVEQDVSLCDIDKVIRIDEETYAYLEGNDSIKLDTYSTYYLKADFFYDSISYSLDNNDLATLQTTNDNRCVIHANNKNKLGYVNLTAECNGKTYAKKIKIIPLW